VRGRHARKVELRLTAAPPHPRAQEIVYDFLSSRALLPREKGLFLRRYFAFVQPRPAMHTVKFASIL
jgi:hypothetical protein